MSLEVTRGERAIRSLLRELDDLRATLSDTQEELQAERSLTELLVAEQLCGSAFWQKHNKLR